MTAGLARWCILVVVAALVVDQLLPVVAGGRVEYKYKRYTYKKKQHEKHYKSVKQPCEVNPDCLKLRGANQTICIRKCISEFCYTDLYGHDEFRDLENMEGFVDSGPMPPIKINEINGLWAFLCAIDWTEPWLSGLGIFHVVCAILTIATRNTGAIQTVYFGILMLLVFFAEGINSWAAHNWKLFARQQYFDSNGLFISIVFSVPLLCNCLVIVVSWLWDVGHLISNVKQMKYRIGSRQAAVRRTQPDIPEGEEPTDEAKAQGTGDETENNEDREETKKEK